MCNEIEFNVIFLFISLQWTVVNTDGTIIVVILLLWLDMTLLLIITNKIIDSIYLLKNNIFFLQNKFQKK